MVQASQMDPRPVAFVCAMPMELVPLARDLELTETDIGGVRVHAGALGDRPVVAIVTGMGTGLARAGIEQLLDVVNVVHVFSVGIAGALEDDTPIGTVMLPEIVMDGATGREHRPTRHGDDVHAGRMWTGDELITDREALADLRARGVVSLEMETAAIAQVCDARGVAWSVFRAISDRPSDDVSVEMFMMSNLDGTPDHDAIAAFFEKYPERIPQLAQLGENSTLAAEQAAAAAIRAGANL